MKEQIKKQIQAAIEKLYPEAADVEFSVDYAPANIDADFASNVALVLAKKLGKRPMEVAEELKSDLSAPSGHLPNDFSIFPSPPTGGEGVRRTDEGAVVRPLPSDQGRRPSPGLGRGILKKQWPGEKGINVAEVFRPPSGADESARYDGNLKVSVTIVHPGFLNFKLPAIAWQDELGRMMEQGEKYGRSKINEGKKARVEYVSANPTGPIHIGNARGGPYGETICRILEATGYEVLREYIHNDIGGQVEKLGATLWYWYEKLHGRDTPFPEGGYQGGYLEEVAKNAPKDLDVVGLTSFALEYIFKENLETMKRMGIEFDLIVKESDLKKSGKTDAAVAEFKERGLIKEKDGAQWFVHPSLPLPPLKGGEGGEEEREAVVVKSNGDTTYFASDIAYHKEKFTSGYDLVMDIFGSNHHGHKPKLQALARVFGFAPERFLVLLYQYVRVKKGQEVVKMSKRAGNYITAKEVLDEVGAGSMIFFLLSTAVNTHMDFDLELARDTSEKNPVYKVQYAHARINSILRKSDVGSRMSEGDSIASLQNDAELGLIKELAKFPELVEELAQTYEVHRLPHYLLGLADKFHSFYEKVRVISDNTQEMAARLALVTATKNVLAAGLRLMAIEPMEKM